jgi:predicted transcriptional regulator
MHPGIITCAPDASLGLVALLLTNHRVHAIAVADKSGRVLGIVTDIDLLAAEWLSTDQERLEAMKRMTARDLMTTPVNAISANAPAKKAAKKLISNNIHRLLVEDEGKPVGMISVADFVADIAGSDTTEGKTVSDLMSDAILVCRDKTPVRNTARSMMFAGWRSIVVVNERGKPIGMVIGKDILNLYGQDVDLDAMLVTEIMQPPVTIHMEATLREAADMMIEHHNHRLIVVDPDMPDAMPLGIISTYDIVEKIARPEFGWH